MPDQQFVEILRSFVSVSYHFGITGPHLVREKMSLLGLESDYRYWSLGFNSSWLWDALSDWRANWMDAQSGVRNHVCWFLSCKPPDLAQGPLNVSDQLLSRLTQIKWNQSKPPHTIANAYFSGTNEMNSSKWRRKFGKVRSREQTEFLFSLLVRATPWSQSERIVLNYKLNLPVSSLHLWIPLTGLQCIGNFLITSTGNK